MYVLAKEKTHVKRMENNLNRHVLENNNRKIGEDNFEMRIATWNCLFLLGEKIVKKFVFFKIFCNFWEGWRHI